MYKCAWAISNVCIPSHTRSHPTHGGENNIQHLKLKQETVKLKIVQSETWTHDSWGKTLFSSHWRTRVNPNGNQNWFPVSHHKLFHCILKTKDEIACPGISFTSMSHPSLLQPKYQTELCLTWGIWDWRKRTVLAVCHSTCKQPGDRAKWQSQQTRAQKNYAKVK